MTKFNHPNENAPLAGEANQETKTYGQVIANAEKLSNDQKDYAAVLDQTDGIGPADAATTVTLFRNKWETTGSRRTLLWTELVAMHASPKVCKDKKSLPLIKYSALPGDSRAAGTAHDNITAIVGDYDDGQVSIAEAAKLVSAAGIRAFFYTTGRHRPERHRWRVVVGLSCAISSDELCRHVDVLNGALGGILAPESWESTRGYFHGRVDGKEYLFRETHGDPLDTRMAAGIDWKPAPKKHGEKSENKQSVHKTKPPSGDRELYRVAAIHQANDNTILELSLALEVIKDRADDRAKWNETFLAMMSLKGTIYDAEARALIEAWSQNHSEKWGEKEDDGTKWDRETSREITYKSIFSWADDEDRRNGIYGTPSGWRARAKADRQKLDSIRDVGANVFSFSEFTAALQPPYYVWHHVLQRGCLYALTAKWGHGKTAVMVTVALHLAIGRSLGGHASMPARVLYLCGENPEDVRLRARAAAIRFGVEAAELETQIYFTKRPVSLDKPEQLCRFVEDAATYGPFGLIVIDTGPAHSAADDEDDNRDMHMLAMAIRDLMEPLGNPATVALMHPTKSAEREGLQPRGGGAFSGSIDGELCAWHENGKVEFFHRTKFRGPGFSSIWFDLEKFTLPAMLDNFGNPVQTVLAVESSVSGEAKGGGRRTGSADVAFRALKALLEDDDSVFCEAPAWARDAAKELGCAAPKRAETVRNWRAKVDASRGTRISPDAARKYFQRAMKPLVDTGQVFVWSEMCWLA